MKKYFTFGLIMSLVGGACFAEHPMITQLLQEKQAKMKKLESCQGTTKNLKIAGISTLGITAVGVGANIAEAVVLSNTKDDVKKAKDARDEQLQIKSEREKRAANHQEFIELCRKMGGTLTNSEKLCLKDITDPVAYNSLVSMLQRETWNCTAEAPNVTLCKDKDDHILSIYLKTDQEQGGQKKEDSKETSQSHVIHKILTLPEIEKEVSEYLKKPEAKCSQKSTSLAWTSGYTWETTCDGIKHEFTFDGVKCDANQKFADGECMAEAQAKKPLKQRCDEAFGKAGQERLACCYAGGATKWDDKTSTCSCKKSDQEWKGGKCVAKPGGGNNGAGGKGGADGKSAGDKSVPVEQLPSDGSVVVNKCRTAWGESFLNQTANVYHCDNNRDYVDINLDKAKAELREFYNAIGCELSFKPTLMANKTIYTDCAKNKVSGNDYILISYNTITCPYGYELNENSAQCDKVDVAPEAFAKACGVIGAVVDGKGCTKEIYPDTEDSYAQAIAQLKSHKSTLSGSDYGFNCELEGDNTALSCNKGGYEVMEWVYDNKINCGDNTFNPATGKCEAAPDNTNKQEYKTYNYDCDIAIKAEYGDIIEGLQKCNDGKGFHGGYNYEQIKDNQWKQTIDEEKTIRIWTLRNLYCDTGYALVKGLCQQLSAKAIQKQKEIDDFSKQLSAEFDEIEKKVEQNKDPKTVCEKVGGGQYTTYSKPLKTDNTYLSYCNNISEAKCKEVIREYTGTYGHFEWKEERFFNSGYQQNEYFSYEPNSDTVETKCWFYNK